MVAGAPLLGASPELDSLAGINVIATIEDQFAIRIADDEVSGDVFATFCTLVEFVTHKGEK